MSNSSEKMETSTALNVTVGKPAKAISQTYDKAARHELWQITQEFLEGFLTRELKNLASGKFN